MPNGPVDNIRHCGITIALIAVNCLISLFGFLLDGFIESYALIAEKVFGGEWFRLVTSMFLHGGMMHLVSNMVAIYCICQILEMQVGHLKCLLIYFVSGLCGGLMVLLIEDPAVITVGASGAIFGSMAAALIGVLKNRDRFKIRGIVINLILNLYVTFTEPGISIGGHIGGLLGGVVLGLLLIKPLTSDRTWQGSSGFGR